MNAKQLKEQEVEECLDRERNEREPRYPLGRSRHPLMSPPKLTQKDIQWLMQETEPIEFTDEFEATGLKPHWHDRKCWCGTCHYDE